MLRKPFYSLQETGGVHLLFLF